MTSVITSSQNQVYKELLKLLKPKGMKEKQTCLVAGVKIIKELLRSQPENCMQLIFSDSDDSSLWSNSELKKSLVFSTVLFKELDQLGTGSPLLLFNFSSNISPLESLKNLTKSSVVSAVGDPANMGAIARSALAFGVDQLVCLSEGAFPYSQKAIKASSGAILNMKIFRGPSLKELAEDSDQSHATLISLDLEGENLESFSWPIPFHLLVGEEGQGLPEGLRSTRVHINTNSAVESLNAAVAMGIALYSSQIK